MVVSDQCAKHRGYSRMRSDLIRIQAVMGINEPVLDPGSLCNSVNFISRKAYTQN